MTRMYLCVLDGSADSDGNTGHGAAVTTLRVGHCPTVLTAKVHLAKLCSPSTCYAELRLDHLSDTGKRKSTFTKWKLVVAFKTT